MQLIIRCLMIYIYLLFLGSIAIAQHFPDGLIAYTPHENCEHYCVNRILIIDPNTGETVEIESDGHHTIYSESLDWSAGQRYLLYWTNDFKANIADANTGETVGEIEFFQEIGRPIRQGVWYDWHPTQPLIAFIYISDFEPDQPFHSLHLFDVPTQQWIPLIDDLNIHPYLVQWSPDGQKILFRSGDVGTYPESDLYIYDMLTQNIVNLTDASNWYGHPDWSADSERITYVLDTDVLIHNIYTQEIESLYDFEDLHIGGSEWALDDTAILVWTHDTSNEDNDIEFYLIDLAEKSSDLILEVSSHFSGYDISPDGTAIVYLAGETNPKDVCILSLITQEEACLDGEKAYRVSYPAWGN